MEMSARHPPNVKSQTQADAVIVVDGLVKRFGSVVALNGLDLNVRRGQVHGFLGPNGAGKSTTLRVLLGQLRADDGHVQVFGADPWADAVAIHARLAYVPGDVTLWPGLTGGECIDILGSFHGDVHTARRDQLIERFELDPSRRTRAYSKGNRRKVALIAALATDAELFLLDEPTSGLDPLMEAEFQTVVREMTGAGCTVLLSSHILGEVEALCDHVSIIRGGRTVRTGTLADLRAHTSTTITVTTHGPADQVETIPGVVATTATLLAGGLVRTTCTVSPDAVPQTLRTLLHHDAFDVVVAPPSLDQLFLDEYRDDTP